MVDEEHRVRIHTVVSIYTNVVRYFLWWNGMKYLYNSEVERKLDDRFLYLPHHFLLFLTFSNFILLFILSRLVFIEMRKLEKNKIKTRKWS